MFGRQVRTAAMVAALAGGAAFLVFNLVERERSAAIESVAATLRDSARLSADLEAEATDFRRRSALFLANTPPPAGIARALANDGYDPIEQSSLRLWTQRLEVIFAAYIDANPEVYQLRLITASDGGRELVRVERRDDGIHVVSGEHLQQKADRDYFIDTMALRPGAVYVSDINLNQERGRIEVPYRPTARVATPVQSASGENFGILIINLEKETRMARWRQAAPTSGALYVVNQDGDFVSHPDEAKQFGFDLGARRLWGDEFELASKVETATGLTAWRSNGELFHAAEVVLPRQLGDAGRYLKFIAVMPDTIVQSQVTSAVIRQTAALGSGGLLIGGIAVWYGRRQREAAAHQARLAAIVENSNDAIVGKNLEGVIVSWNAAAERIFGYPSAQAVGRSVAELLIPDGRLDEESRILATVMRGETVGHFETVRRHRSGHLIDVQVTVSPVRDASGRVVGAAKIARDITADKRAQKDLHLATTRLAQITHAMGIGLWEWDLVSGGLSWDQTMYELYDCKPSDDGLSYESWANRVHPEDLTRIEVEIDAAVQTTGNLDSSFRVRDRSGNVRHLLAKGLVEKDSNGQAIRMLGTNFDITQLKEQEEKLRDAMVRIQVGEARWRELANSMPHLVWTCSGDGPCDFLSEQWVHYTGIPEQPQLGFGWLDQVHPADREALALLWQQAVESRGIFHTEFRIRRYDGVYRWFDTRAVPLIDPGSGEILRWFGSNTDIEDRKRAESAVKNLNATLERQVEDRTARLREALALQTAILNDAAFAVISTDTRGVITGFNPAAERLLGYRAEEMVGKVTPAVIHDSREVTERAHALSDELGRRIEPGFEVFVAKTRDGTPDTNEWTYLKKDGARIPVWLSVSALLDERGEPMGFVGMVVDLTERKTYEEKIQQSERFLRALTDNIPGLVGYWDTNLRCKYANREYQRWFDKSAEQMRDILLPDLLGDRLFEASEPHVRGALRGEIQRFERRSEDRRGIQRVTQVHYIPDIEAGQVRGFYAVVTDVTDLKRAQFQLESANASLAQRTREAESATKAKSQFLANMSHEIRTPMNAVLGTIQLLQRTPLAATQRDYVSKAESAARALLQILNDILDFSKIDAGKLTLEQRPFRVDTLLRELSAILSATLGGKDVELLFDVGESVPMEVEGDAMRLQQVLLNLATNAVKFTERGEVVLGVHRRPSRPGTARLEFSVSDTGIGISEEQISRIFSGFEQAEASTTRRYGGTGLGLAISQRIVTVMGGELRVESVLGRGSRFTFEVTLPALDPMAPQQAVSAKGWVQLRGLRILVVDDNAAARSILSGYVKSFGWAVDVAATAAAAEAMLTNGSDQEHRYDVAFVDWRLPDGDGWQLVEKIRATGAGGRTPLVIMATAHGRDALNEPLAIDARLLDGFLVKPLTPSMILDAVADALAGRGHPQIASAAATPQQRLTGVRLLLVEDNPTNQDIAKDLLVGEGAVVEVAGSGRSGVEAVRGAQTPFDVVLMDLQMPDIDGYEATRLIRSSVSSEKLPIIAMTANALPQDRDTCLAAGMNDHVGKPFDLDHLVMVILKNLGRLDGDIPEPVITAEQDAFSIDAAIARLGGRRDLYAREVGRFRSSFADYPARIKAYLAQGHVQAAVPLLHSLKGVAGTLGAMALSHEARLLESRITAGVATDAVIGEVDALAASLERATSHLESASADPEPPRAPQTSVPPGATREKLVALEQCLSTSDMRALSLHAELSGALHGIDSAAAIELEGCMDRLDLQSALTVCQSLLRSL